MVNIVFSLGGFFIAKWSFLKLFAPPAKGKGDCLQISLCALA